MLIKLTTDTVPLSNHVKMETLIWAVTHAMFFCSPALSIKQNKHIFRALREGGASWISCPWTASVK